MSYYKAFVGNTGTFFVFSGGFIHQPQHCTVVRLRQTNHSGRHKRVKRENMILFGMTTGDGAEFSDWTPL